MATAEELLRNSAIQPNPEGHIIVGGDRRIVIPDSLKRLGVQYDHNMETVVFDCPRYWDNRDMSEMAIYINYMRSDKQGDRYPVDNVCVDGEIMHFDWTISRNVTEVPGTVSFLVCVMKTDAEGNEERHWNSELSQEAYISPGMETEEHPALDYPDEVTQLLLRMSTVEKINVQADEMQRLYEATVEVANTAEETKNQALDTSNYIKNSYANAIKGNASGEIIRVDDVSPIEHQVRCWVHGKNLLNDAKFKIETQTKSGVTCTANADGSYTISGANTSSTFVTFGSNRSTNYEDEPLIPSGTYTPTSGVTVVCRDEVTGKETNQQQTFEAINPFRIMGWYCYVSPNTDVLGGSYTKLPATIYPQLEQGSIATTQEPHVDPTTVTVVGCGKNVLELSENITQNGVTKTVDSNGLITVKGTSTSSININVGIGFMKAGYKYRPIIQKIKSDVAPSFWNFQMQANIDKDKDGYISTPVDTEFSAFIYTASAGTVYDSAFRVMVELVTDNTTDEYESYKGDNVVVTSADGTCTVTSKSPTITLFTDTPGVTIEAEYNVDTEKFLNANIVTDRIQAATDAWLTAHYTEAEGVSF